MNYEDAVVAGPASDGPGQEELAEALSNPKEATNPVYEAALAYASMGWSVLPLHGVKLENDLCSCGKADCSIVGKHPSLMNWVKGASNQPEQLRTWFAYTDCRNIGIRTGGESGLIVIDIDRKGGVDGAESLKAMEDRYGKLPETITATTPTGGIHYYFHASPDIKSTSTVLGYSGVDVRCDGGMVVAPPSHRPIGDYAWMDGHGFDEIQLAELPAAWLEALPKINQQKTATTTSNVGHDVIAEGGRNTYLASIAGKLRRDGLGHDPILNSLLAINKTVCTPPLADAEVASIAHSVTRYEPGQVSRVKSPQELRMIVDEPAGADQPVQPEGYRRRLKTAEDLLSRAKNVHWVIEGIIAEKADVLVWGLPGKGKSFISVNASLSVATGKPFVDTYTCRQGNVIYVPLEGQSGLPVRVAAWLKSQDLTPADLVAWNWWQDAVDLSDPGSIEQFIMDAKEWLKQERNGEPLSLVVIDTLAAARGSANENDNSEMGTALNNLRVIRQQLGCASILVHHSAKNSKTERGAGVILGNVDLSLMVSQPEHDDTKVIIECRKARDIGLLEDIHLKLVEVELEGNDNSCVLAPDVIPPNCLDYETSTVLNTLAELTSAWKQGPQGATRTEWLTACRGRQITKNAFNEAVKDSVRARMVESHKDGKNMRYTPSDRYYAQANKGLMA